MVVTLQQIAEAAGVSRGTVDRALNNRGRINPQVAEKIRKIAQEMGYQPNRAGRALAMSRKSVKIGVIFQAAETPFMKTVLAGTQVAKDEVERMGGSVQIRKLDGWDAEKAVKTMYELKEEGCEGIAIAPMDDEELRDVIDEFMEKNIPVITFNSDIEKSRRLCFVGYDTRQNGQVAAGLMAEIVPANGRVLMISGYPSNQTHKEKAESFVEELHLCREDIHIIDRCAFDNDKLAGSLTDAALKEYDDISAIYLVATGVQSVSALLAKRGLSGKIKVISNDLTEENKQLLREGKIQFLLGQEGYRQGYEPVMLLFEKLFDGKTPEEEFAYPEIVIKTKYNL